MKSTKSTSTVHIFLLIFSFFILFFSSIIIVECRPETPDFSPETVINKDHQNQNQQDQHNRDHDHDHDHDQQNSSSNSTNSNSKKSTPKYYAYIYGTIAVAFVSLLSLAGVIVIPFIKRKIVYDAIMLTFMSLAVGTMTSDAILHLIPETLGLHGHEHGAEGEGQDDHDHDHEDHEDHEHSEQAVLGKMCAFLATLYGLYLLELFTHTISKLMKRSSNIVKPDVMKMAEVVMAPAMEPTAGTAKKWQPVNAHGHSHGHHGGDNDDSSQGGTILGLKSVAFVVVISDAMHNFTDGLAIGAAFSKSSAAGLGVTIAVMCHELPHEIGNFAILLNTGLPFKKALLLNFLSAVTSFAGVYPGIIAGQQKAMAQWIFAAVAGGFLYVALVHMLRELQHFDRLPIYLSVILQNLGLLVGFGIIFLLAVYEEQMGSMA